MIYSTSYYNTDHGHSVFWWLRDDYRGNSRQAIKS